MAVGSSRMLDKVVVASSTIFSVYFHDEAG